MYFQIKEVVLWPRNPQRSPRRLKFALGQVNVISGASRTGKSAVIPIIDYCLGSGTCSIPVNTIRHHCEWFGVIVATKDGDKLFARREPGPQRSTDDMYVMEAPEVQDIPSHLVKNTNADAVRRMLDELVGLTKLDFGSSESGFDARPSFRDLAAFTFQPQNVVANPDVLFFKTSTYEHREKLRKIFPYVLGAITPALMAIQYELRRVQSELRRLERELREAEFVSDRWTAELRSKISEARELGLLELDDGVELSRDQMLEHLNEIVSRTDIAISVSAKTISDAIAELTSLEAEERAVSRELTALRHRLAEMSRIRVGADTYQAALRIQQDRLQISDWLLKHTTEEEECPVCGNHLKAANDKLVELHKALKGIEDAAGTTDELPAAFDRELQRVQQEVNEGAEKLRANRIRRANLSDRSEEAKQRQYLAQRAERFVGNLENALQLHQKLGSDSSLREEVHSLRNRERALQSELKRHDVEAQKRRALLSVNSNAGKLLPHLDVEHPNSPISLEISDLTIKVTGQSRDDYLSEIGSGSNWLSYHIATMLALQQFFLSLKHSSVPSFIVFDQPSQVYFPRRLAAAPDDLEDDPVLRDEDVVAVRKVFQVLAGATLASGGQLQVIVLDHAPKEVWGDIAGTVGLEEWRGGTKLVPEEWIG